MLSTDLDDVASEPFEAGVTMPSRSIRFSDALWAECVDAARERGLLASDIVRQAVVVWLRADGRQPPTR